MRPIFWFWLGLCSAAVGRPVVLVLAPDQPFASRAEMLTEQLVSYGGLSREDLWVAPDAGELVDWIEDRELLKLGRDDTLLMILAGRLSRDLDGSPNLLTRREAAPLDVLFTLLGGLEPKSFGILAELPPEPDTKPLAALEGWPERAPPVAMLVGDDDRLLRAAAVAVRDLAADVNDDGLVDVRELAAAVNPAGKPPAARLKLRPETATPPVAGLGGPDVTPPLVLILEPRRPRDGPLLLERAGALRLRGLVADDRRVVGLTANAQTATLTEPGDATYAGLGYAHRARIFDVSVPLAEAGYTTIELLATDAAGNQARESFLVLVGPADNLPPPGEGSLAPGDGSRVDAVRFEWGVTEDWRYGFRMQVDATVRGRRGRPCRAAVRFTFADGRPVQDFNGWFADTSGRVAVTADFTPTFDEAVVRGITLFVPQRELHLAAGQQHRLQATVTLLDVGMEPPEVLAVSAPLPLELSEPAQGATVTRFELAHNQRQGTERGILFTGGFHTTGMQGLPCQVAVYLQRADGQPLLDRNQRYRAGDGTVALFRDVSPGYPSATFRELTLFLPYDELELPEPGKFPLRARLVVWDKRARRALDASPWQYFTVTQQ